MRPSQPLATCNSRIAFLVCIIFAASTVFATAEKTVYSFLGVPDGSYPATGLIADAAGNLYGTTVEGGAGVPCPCGTVFELSPPTTEGGSWTETIIHSFASGPSDGASPYGTLIFDKLGNLYGTTESGGVNNIGTVFELSPPAESGGPWTETLLWIFPSSGRSGFYPTGKLAMDASGNLYGTTGDGGANFPSCHCGLVYELVKPKAASQKWTERVLYNFGSVAGDGFAPGSGVILRNLTLYGTTSAGGSGGGGVVFSLTPKSGLWSETILHNFRADVGGSDPLGGVIDSVGNLYGTTERAGDPSSLCIRSNGCGTIYELSPPSAPGGGWEETTLYSFMDSGDGSRPGAALWRDKQGNLYGTATQGGLKNPSGSPPRLGTVFKLKPPSVSGGTWSFAVLHKFGGVSANGDGGYPTDELVLVDGALYGTTFLGGTSNLGAVFSLVP